MMSTDVAVRRDRWPSVWDWLDGPGIVRWFEGMPKIFGDEDWLRIEEEMTADTMVIRAEMPGIDPDKDVEVTVADGLLTIRAERRFEEKDEKKGRTRTEFRYGSFARTVRVPQNMSVDDVTASYKDGILEVRYPYKAPTEAPPPKVAVTKS
jgi:HSP20 family protein